MIVKGDGPVMKLRRWYAQFYSLGKRISSDEDGASSSARSEQSDVCTSSCEDHRDGGELTW